MSKKRNPSKHFRREKRYLCSIGLFNLKPDWYMQCGCCVHHLPEDGDSMYGDYTPAWCLKKCRELKDIELPKRPKCFRRFCGKRKMI